jgi:hypothetical protein
MTTTNERKRNVLASSISRNQHELQDILQDIKGVTFGKVLYLSP